MNDFNYDAWKLDNSDNGEFQDEFSVTAHGTEEALDEFAVKFREAMLELAKECDVNIK